MTSSHQHSCQSTCNSSISICPRNAEYGLACGKETRRSCKRFDAPVQADCKNSSKFAPERIAFAGLMLRYLRHVPTGGRRNSSTHSLSSAFCKMVSVALTSLAVARWSATDVGDSGALSPGPGMYASSAPVSRQFQLLMCRWLSKRHRSEFPRLRSLRSARIDDPNTHAPAFVQPPR